MGLKPLLNRMGIIIIFLLLATLLYIGALDYKADNITYCPEITTERSFPVDIRHRIVNDQQEFTGNITMYKDFHNNNSFLVEAYRVIGKKAILLGAIKGKGGCKSINKYGGAAWLKITKLGHVEHPNVCPIPGKNYSLTGYYPVNAEDVPILKLVPKGKFRIFLIMNDTSGKVDFCCRFDFQRF